MRFATSIFAVLATVGFVAAARTGSLKAKDVECNAQNIVDACRTGIEFQIDKCIANDWVCLCQNYQNLLTCYNNCPDSLFRSPVENQVTSYCAAAAPIISKSMADEAADAATRPVPSAAATSAVVEPTSTDSTPVNTASATQTTEAAATFTGVASKMVAPVGGLAAVLLGLAGLL